MDPDPHPYPHDNLNPDQFLHAHRDAYCDAYAVDKY
jgi:hypothetical protein